MDLNINHVTDGISKLAHDNGRARVVLVYNPRSSKAKRVETEVIKPLREMMKKGSGLTLAKYEVQPTNVDDNAKKLSKILLDNDVVVTAGGDGTATIGLNGAMLAKKEIYFWALPFGNFNDMPRMLEKTNDSERKLYPLEAVVNGKHYRYAACYFTIGLFAESTEVFDAPAQRKHLQEGKDSLVYSVLQLAKWYFKNRKREFIPDFEEQQVFISVPRHNITDYIAINGVSVARIMRVERRMKWYLQPDGFISTMRNLSGFFPLCWFMIRSIFHHIPAKVALPDGDVLIFKKPASFEIQAEGEYKKLTGVKKIEIKKADHTLHIL